MTYTDQIEQYVAAYPETVLASVPATCGVVELPSYPSVVVQAWSEDFCELEDEVWRVTARFRLVG